MYINGWTRDKVMKQIRFKNLGYPSVDCGSSECRYRHKEDNQTNCCLVGAFIPDEKYNKDMEGRPSHYITRKFDLHQDMPMDEDSMGKLQRLHDHVLVDLEGEEFFKAIEKNLIQMEKK